MSGKQQVSFSSDYYMMTITGGISSWDYEGMREKDDQLKGTLLALKPGLDEAFTSVVNERQLHSLISLYDAKAISIDGIVIEADAEQEAANRRHFKQYRNGSKNGLFSASHEQYIANTSFEVILNIVVKDRINKADLEAILAKQIDILEQSPALMKMLY